LLGHDFKQYHVFSLFVVRLDQQVPVYVEFVEAHQIPGTPHSILNANWSSEFTSQSKFNLHVFQKFAHE
jgi:hypothetical protein